MAYADAIVKKCISAAANQLERYTPSPVKPEPQYEVWYPTYSGNQIDAKLTAIDEKENYGSVRGYKKAKTSDQPVETLNIAYYGHSAGRGSYYLERIYNGSTPKSAWWRGEQTGYDCHRKLVTHCPYILGPMSDMKEMAEDSWLKTPCG